MLSNIVVRLVPEKLVALNVPVPAALIAVLKLSWVAYSVCTSEVSVVKELESVVIESALTTPLTFEIAVDRPLRFAAAIFVTPPTETLVKTVFTKVELLKSTVEPEVVEESWVAKAEMTAFEATSVVEPAAVFAAAVPATIKLAT